MADQLHREGVLAKQIQNKQETSVEILHKDPKLYLLSNLKNPLFNFVGMKHNHSMEALPAPFFDKLIKVHAAHLHFYSKKKAHLHLARLLNSTNFQGCVTV